MSRPSVFIGSSSEGRDFAIAVQAELRRHAEAATWDQGVFAPGQMFIESLMKAVSLYDFAVLILTPDDKIQSRSKRSSSPRDNVIFEIGLFMGKLGRDRTFILQHPGSDIKVPTDLSGIITISYDWPREDGRRQSAVAPACQTIGERIQALGRRERQEASDMFAGLDGSVVEEKDGVVLSNINGCEIRAVVGRIEDYAASKTTAVVLPCNEYFDDECAADTRSALGAYVNKVFPGKVRKFIEFVKTECQNKIGPGAERQKKENESALSFGPGRAILLMHPLGSSVPVGLISTTTQRAGQGLVAKSSFLFEGVCELVTRLVDERLNDIVMPVLGSGHGGMDSPTAFVSLVLALAEAVRYAPKGRPLERATVVVFKKNAESRPEVDPVVVRRALAIAAAPGHRSFGRS